MLPPELEVIAEIPCYRVILKSLLKYQIQQLVAQLKEFGEEEALLLTASIEDGTVSGIGTKGGKEFIKQYDDLESNFLRFISGVDDSCVKEEISVEETTDDEDTGTQSQNPSFRPSQEPQRIASSQNEINTSSTQVPERIVSLQNGQLHKPTHTSNIESKPKQARGKASDNQTKIKTSISKNNSRYQPYVRLQDIGKRTTNLADAKSVKTGDNSYVVEPVNETNIRIVSVKGSVDDFDPREACSDIDTGSERSIPEYNSTPHLTSLPATDECLTGGIDDTSSIAHTKELHVVLEVASSSSTSDNNSSLPSDSLAENEVDQDTIQKPISMCVYCKVIVKDDHVRRHITRKHKHTHSAVAEILKQSQKAQYRFFKQKTDQGKVKLIRYRREKKGSSKEQSQEKDKRLDSMRVCPNCKGIFTTGSYPSHELRCKGFNLSGGPFDAQEDKQLQFVSDILDSLDRPVGNVIKQNKIIQVLGYKYYLAVKSTCSEINIVRAKVVKELREFSKLFLCFSSLLEKDVTFEDMYAIEYLPMLTEALNKLCTSNNNENLTATFQRSFTALTEYYTETHNERKREEFKRFEEAFILSIIKEEGDDRISNQIIQTLPDIATVSLKSTDTSHACQESSHESQESSQKSVENSQKSVESSQKSVESSQKSVESSQKSVESSQKSVESSQKSVDTTHESTEPLSNNTETSLNKEELLRDVFLQFEVMKLKDFITSEIDRVIQTFNLSQYVWLCHLVVARLMLYNARRGEDGSRIKVEEWKAALHDDPIIPERINTISDPMEELLDGQFIFAYYAAYSADKDKKYVPIMIPIDLIQAMKILLENRDKAGALRRNKFLFAWKKSHKMYCHGRLALNSVCNMAGLSKRVVNNRYRASTIYICLEISKGDRKTFLKCLDKAKSSEIPRNSLKYTSYCKRKKFYSYELVDNLVEKNWSNGNRKTILKFPYTSESSENTDTHTEDADKTMRSSSRPRKPTYKAVLMAEAAKRRKIAREAILSAEKEPRPEVYVERWESNPMDFDVDQANLP